MQYGLFDYVFAYVPGVDKVSICYKFEGLGLCGLYDRQFVIQKSMDRFETFRPVYTEALKYFPPVEKEVRKC